MSQVYDDKAPVIDSCVSPPPITAEFYAKVNVLLPKFSDNSVYKLRGNNTDPHTMPASVSMNHSLSIHYSEAIRYVWAYGVTSIEVTAEDTSGNNVTCRMNITVLGRCTPVVI